MAKSVHSVSPWRGQLFLMEGRALYLGLAADADSHAHHAAQIAIALEGTFKLADPYGIALDTRAALVPPNAMHRLEGGGQPLAILFLDPESMPARHLASQGKDPIQLDEALFRPLLPKLLQAYQEGINFQEGWDFCEELLQALAPAERAAPLDPRVRRAIALLRDHPGTPPLSEVSKAVGLSPSRLGHLFSEQVGLPLRPYLLWLRLQRVLIALAQGGTLTMAAHDAGFADSAHLSRTFRRMFGITPSSLAGGMRIILAPQP